MAEDTKDQQVEKYKNGINNNIFTVIINDYINRKNKLNSKSNLANVAQKARAKNNVKKEW
jgi:hypothetical protein